MSAKLLTVLIICLTEVYAQHDYGLCPHCTDPYNPASCTQKQTCNAQSCRLQVHRGDRNRIEFSCHLVCVSFGTLGCSDHQGTCTYCCRGLAACLEQLDDLFPVSSTATSFPTTSAPELLTTSASATTWTPEALLTTSASATTGTPEALLTTSASATTGTPEALVTTSASATTGTPEALVTTSVSATTGTPEALLTTSVAIDFSTTATTTIPVTAQTSQSCVQCGDFAFDKPCTPIELLLNDASSCPEGLPYCFETININGDNLQVVRGCAEPNFCRVEWDIGHSRSGCYPLDVTTPNVNCTYCCSGASCNNITPPEAELQVPFP